MTDRAVTAAPEIAGADAGVEPSTPRSHRIERERCFHCGETCADSNFASGEKIFCCNGCLVVHDLLAENGLENFYSLTEHPGVRIRAASKSEQWGFLDEPALRQKLLDFTDGKISRVTLHIPAIHCVACVWLLENLFRLHPGISRSQVNFPRREVSIQFVGEKIKLSELVALLASVGYEPALTLNELEKRKIDPARKRRWIQVGVAGFAFGNIMLFSLPRYLGLDSFSGEFFARLFGWISLVLAIPVLVYSASDYWKSALLSLRQRVLTLDVPIALGLAAIYGTSAFQILSRTGEGYCDSLTGLIFFLLCGRAFQQKTHERIAFDRDYKSFFPLSVKRKKSDGTEEHASLSALKTGDRILIRNGELIPADATLINGAAMIDYSFVTGESEAVAKNAGDYLYAGGKQIGGAIEIETVKPVSQSYLTSLWNHETFQKNSDSDLNSLTNRYSRRFTFIVIAVALGAALFWIASGNFPRGIKAFTSVLIVACPCALALAAPFTFGTAQRLLARLNVFVKNALVLERLARVDAIVFDKTGTLTAANSSGVSFRGEPLSADEQSWIGSLARHSTHPLSVRVHEFLRKKNSIGQVTSFREIPGSGIEGEIRGHRILLGSQALLEAGQIEIRNSKFQIRAGSCVNVAIDGKFRGTFVVGNSIRSDIDQLLQKLSARYELALLSGDNERERELFWNFFGSDDAMRFNQTPLDKLGFIGNLQKSGRTVMMVGDGLNDAGALKQSDVGVAVVEKVGAFSPASDVILEASGVPKLDTILKLARASTRIVRLSFAISAAYNLIGISIAAAGILSPLICAVLMPLSSATVILFACGTTTFAARRVCASKNNGECQMTNGIERSSSCARSLFSSFIIRHSSFPKP
jgi:Cu+-exporting ATPase